MSRALHTSKISAEKDAFIGELRASLPNFARLLSGGDLASKARRLHEKFIPLHILNHYKPDPSPLKTEYFELVVTHSIESEALFALGFRNAGMMALRAAIEAAFKFIYYENHPVEWQLHQSGAHDLHGIEFREFLYNFPVLGGLPFNQKRGLEELWTQLCSFVHCDLRSVSKVGVVADFKTILRLPEQQLSQILDRIHVVEKTVVSCCFAVDPKWLLNVEKAYFDVVFDIYTAAERKVIKEGLRIA